MDEALRDADGIVLVTEWDEYRRELDPEHAPDAGARAGSSTVGTGSTAAAPRGVDVFRDGAALS